MLKKLNNARKSNKYIEENAEECVELSIEV